MLDQLEKRKKKKKTLRGNDKLCKIWVEETLWAWAVGRLDSDRCELNHPTLALTTHLAQERQAVYHSWQQGCQGRDRPWPHRWLVGTQREGSRMATVWIGRGVTGINHGDSDSVGRWMLPGSETFFLWNVGGTLMEMSSRQREVWEQHLLMLWYTSQPLLRYALGFSSLLSLLPFLPFALVPCPSSPSLPSFFPFSPSLCKNHTSLHNTLQGI